MTDAARTHLEVVSPGVFVAAYADGDVVIRVSDDYSVVFEPAQLRELRQVLRKLPDEESIATSLGENSLGEEGYIEWNGSIAYLFDEYPSYGMSLTETDAIELEKWLFELGY